jgi:hypothetical protein
MELTPSVLMTAFRDGLVKGGMKPKKSAGPISAQGDFRLKRVPVSRLIARMGLSAYDAEAPLEEKPYAAARVRIPLRMHLGKPSVPCVAAGAAVKRGNRIAAIPEGALGAEVHASIDGKVTQVTDSFMEITGKEARG